MAYIVIHSAEGQELDRRELAGLLIVGRSPDSDLRIHDIMLSREHCGIEEGEGGWVVVDLDSRNGTFVNGERITRHKLEDGDRLKVGQTEIHFHAREMPKAEARKPGLLERPADPFEAMAATMAGFEFDPKFEPPIERPIVRPKPRPMPVPNKGVGSSTLTVSAVTSEQQLSSSPTWATKPLERVPLMREALEQCLPELAAAPQAAEVAAEPALQPVAASNEGWRRKVGVMMGEVLATAALAGTALLLVLAFFS